MLSSSLYAQFQENDYTNSFELGYNKSIYNEDEFCVSYSWIFGNFSIRPEFAISYNGDTQRDSILYFSNIGTAILYSYDIGRVFHITPYVGFGINWTSSDVEEDYNFEPNILYGIKLLYKGFGFYGEGRYFYENEISTFSIGLTFSWRTSYIPVPVDNRPAIKDRERDYF